jgi:hypothetical protein
MKRERKNIESKQDLVFYRAATLSTSHQRGSNYSMFFYFYVAKRGLQPGNHAAATARTTLVVTLTAHAAGAACQTPPEATRRRSEQPAAVN